MITRRGLGLAAASVAALAAAPAGAQSFTRSGGGQVPQNAIDLLAHGDSYLAPSAGTGVTQVSGTIAAQLLGTKGIPSTLTQIGWIGQGFLYVAAGSGSLNNLVNDFPVSIAPAIIPGLPKFLYVATDGNDFAVGGFTPAQSYTAFQAYCAEAIAAGIPASHIVIASMGQRNGCSQSLITSWNSALLGDAGGVGYQVARRDLDANIGVSGLTTNLTYYQIDGIHLAITGQNTLAGIVATLIAATS